MSEPRRRHVHLTLSPSEIARLARLTEWSGASSKSRFIGDMIQREWIRVGRIDQAISDIHDVLDPLAEQPCANPGTDDDMIIVSDCAECPSCKARAALSMLDLDLAAAIRESEQGVGGEPER